MREEKLNDRTVWTSEVDNRRLSTINFNCESSHFMEYISSYEFWNNEERLTDLLNDICYLRR